MFICHYCALQLTKRWWFAGMTISKLEMDCPPSKSSFLLDNVCQKDFILGVHLGRINHQILSVYLSLSFINGLLVWDDNLSLASILIRVSHAGSEITTKVGPRLTASSQEWLHDQMAMIYLTDRQFILSLLFYHS